MRALMQTNVFLIKHNKEFCVPSGRVHLVFVVYGDWAFGTSAWQNNNEKYWDELKHVFWKGDAYRGGFGGVDWVGQRP